MSQDPHEHFGRYELLAQMGRGGMAETWRARLVAAAGVTKLVLIKKVLPEFANDEAFISMFISEARISASLSHGNIAQVFDFGRVEGQYFLAMELVDGQPLHRILKRAARTGLPQLPIPLATYIALEMCRGLHYAHLRTDEKGTPLGIVHRDISPDNVLISYEGQVKIVDFGIAKARMLRNFDTEPGVIRGKYLYFSPEQARGQQVDARTDVWATGLVLYEMLCGQPPVTGNQAVVLSRMAHGEFPAPKQLRKDLPSALNEVVMKALSVDTSLRYESANAFAEALGSFLYSYAPRFSTMNLAYLLRSLYREDLLQDGRELPVPATFAEELRVWRGSDEAAPNAPTIRVPSVSPSAVPKASPGKGRWALLAGVGVLALAAAAIPWLPSSKVPESRVAPPSPLTPVRTVEDAGSAGVRRDAGAPSLARAPETALPTTPSSPEVTGTESIADYPDVTSIRLDSRRHVFRVPLDLVAFSRLDSAVTYQFWSTSPAEGAGSTAVVEPQPRWAPPVYYLISGEAVRPEAREGIVGRQPLKIQGARAISLFTLGEPTEEDLHPEQVYLKDIQVDAERRFTFHPEPMRISPAKGYLVRGLEPRQTYVLSLLGLGDGVFLRGRTQDPAAQVACLEWSPEGATPGGRDPTQPYAVQPLQFLLSEWREVKVRGIQGLRCGFLDDSPFDNEGEAELRISPWDPKRPKEPERPKGTPAEEAERLASRALRLARAGQHQDAYLLAEDCLSHDPHKANCLLLSGDMQARLGKVHGALERYRTFLQVYPTHPMSPSVKQLISEHSRTGVLSSPASASSRNPE
ncbi:serine/threonine protein kinase [Myxococcus stipitatus DSM 14675]|uniref:Serine/threonine protein kinase n=1 Tax=Myxococcus stipitatus (strain DSM 14675 / JCM 12634 / Mx s8) TaxID=1278073 RepID=L7U9D8_MYXSD|nr:serine/threonine protein kinase [Myxococcus stipitatus DSM 14675]